MQKSLDLHNLTDLLLLFYYLETSFFFRYFLWIRVKQVKLLFFQTFTRWTCHDSNPRLAMQIFNFLSPWHVLYRQFVATVSKEDLFLWGNQSKKIMHNRQNLSLNIETPIKTAHRVGDWLIVYPELLYSYIFQDSNLKDVWKYDFWLHLWFMSHDFWPRLDGRLCM